MLANVWPLLLITGLHAEPIAAEPMLAVPGKLLLSLPSGDELPKTWRPTAGQWQLRGGVLVGREIPEQNHGAGVRHPFQAGDVVAAYEFRVGAKNQNATAAFNAGSHHLCRIVFEPKRVMLRKPDQDHGRGPDEQLTLDERPFSIEPGRWHSVVIESLGSDVLVRVDGEVRLFGSHELYRTPKTSIQLTGASDDAVEYRNLQVWIASANPDWPRLRESTLIQRGR